MRQKSLIEHDQHKIKLVTPRGGNPKGVEEFFIGSPNKRASLHTEKAPSSPRTLILKGPSGPLHAKGRERSRRRLFAQHRRAAELNAQHEKEMQELRSRLEESTRCCRDSRTHLERETAHLERRERLHRKGLELRQQREEEELKFCTFKPAKPSPVPATNTPAFPKTNERRLCRQRPEHTAIARRRGDTKTNQVAEESTTDESNTSSVATIRWVRPTLSFAPVQI